MIISFKTNSICTRKLSFKAASEALNSCSHFFSPQREETNVRGFLCNPSDAQAGECYGGMARKATMIKKIRSETKNVLLISGGDVLTGTIWYRVYRGNATRFFMNELGYDIMVSKSSTSA